ncbi:MAG: RDD family protein [Bacteroidetes bacterium]|nr:MAG: RDD family protein [Bacteroidota bacterium]
MQTNRYSTASKRIWASIVDGIVFMPFLLIDRFLISPTESEYFVVGWQMLSVIIPLLYSIVAHYKYGQTIGKWVAGVQVVDISESHKINLKQAIVRASFYLAIKLAAVCYYLFLVVTNGDKAYFFEGFNDLAGTLIMVWFLLNLVTMYSNKKSRAIHDFLAQSVVIASPQAKR